MEPAYQVPNAGHARLKTRNSHVSLRKKMSNYVYYLYVSLDKQAEGAILVTLCNNKKRLMKKDI